MSQGKGKASSGSNRRRSSDDTSRLQLDSSADPPVSAPSSSFDASIPFNLPPRRSMKMLKDGSDYVWPEAAHSLFVRGLQAWKFMNIGSKRTRAPRGEGKTDFLVRYLESHGVVRTKKQVASHLQVLRTEWRNSDNTVLLSLVDDTVPHTRSLSEPSLPTPSSPNVSPSNSLSILNPVPDHGDDRAISTPSLPSPISALPAPPASSSLYHPAHDFYDSSHSYPESVLRGAFGTQSDANTGPWQTEDTVWDAAAAPVPSYHRPDIQYRTPSYNPPSALQDYDLTQRHVPTSALEQHDFGSEYYDLEIGDAASSTAATPLARSSHRMPGLSLDTGSLSYSPYNTSYPLPQVGPQPHAVYGSASISYGTGQYQAHLSAGAKPPMNASSAAGSTLPYSGAVEPAMLAVEQARQQHQQQPQQQSQWLRPPGVQRRHDGSPMP